MDAGLQSGCEYYYYNFRRRIFKMVRKANIIQKQELGGGKGCAEVHEIVPVLAGIVMLVKQNHIIS